MAAKLTFVKKILDDEVVNSYMLILNAVFGDKLPGSYDPTKIYNKGDVILRLIDGRYELLVCIKNNVTGEFNPDYWKKVSFTELFKDGTLIDQNNIVINSKQEGMLDDLATVIFNLAGLLDNQLDLNYIFRENFKTPDRLSIITGNHEPGSLNAIAGSGLNFKLKNPMELKTPPKKFKIKHIIEITGLPSLNCEITFNALDSSPYWFSANDAILNASFFEIPEFQKDEDIPYAMNIRIYGSCNSSSSLKISDLMVMFI